LTRTAAAWQWLFSLDTDEGGVYLEWPGRHEHRSAIGVTGHVADPVRPPCWCY